MRRNRLVDARGFAEGPGRGAGTATGVADDRDLRVGVRFVLESCPRLDAAAVVGVARPSCIYVGGYAELVRGSVRRGEHQAHKGTAGGGSPCVDHLQRQIDKSLAPPESVLISSGRGGPRRSYVGEERRRSSACGPLA